MVYTVPIASGPVATRLLDQAMTAHYLVAFGYLYGLIYTWP